MEPDLRSKFYANFADQQGNGAAASHQMDSSQLLSYYAPMGENSGCCNTAGNGTGAPFLENDIHFAQAQCITQCGMPAVCNGYQTQGEPNEAFASTCRHQSLRPPTPQVVHSWILEAIQYLESKSLMASPTRDTIISYILYNFPHLQEMEKRIQQSVDLLLHKLLRKGELLFAHGVFRLPPGNTKKRYQ